MARTRLMARRPTCQCLPRGYVVTGLSLEHEALIKLQRKKGPSECYLPYAVGDGDPHTLNICRYSGMTSLLEPDPATLGLFGVLKSLAEVIEPVLLQTRRLDDISEVQHVDFLKIDIQGSELAVFKGGKRSSQRRWRSRPRSRL